MSAGIAQSNVLDAALLSVIDTEDGELLAAEMVEEIVCRGQDVLFDKHISSQVLPYAVQFSKETLVHMIEWDLFKQDVASTSSESWIADQEPLPLTIDTWARGVLPFRPRSCINGLSSFILVSNMSTIHDSTSTTATIKSIDNDMPIEHPVKVSSASTSSPTKTVTIAEDKAQKPTEVKKKANDTPKQPSKPRFTTSLRKTVPELPRANVIPNISQSPLPPSSQLDSTRQALSPRTRTYKTSNPLLKPSNKVTSAIALTPTEVQMTTNSDKVNHDSSTDSDHVIQIHSRLTV